MLPRKESRPSQKRTARRLMLAAGGAAAAAFIAVAAYGQLHPRLASAGNASAAPDPGGVGAASPTGGAGAGAAAGGQPGHGADTGSGGQPGHGDSAGSGGQPVAGLGPATGDKSGAGVDTVGGDPAGPRPAPGAASPGSFPPEQDDAALVEYDGPVEHIFFHPLIAYPERAFDGDAMAKGYNDWFTTVPEFTNIIGQLYKNNFILIDINSLYSLDPKDGQPTLRARPLRLPPGKKPLILSIDDLNYYPYMLENGNVSKLVLDAHGKIATQSVDSKGETVTSYGNEIVPLLDSFVSAHPDFALHGAKGVIALTGYEGILGYRTNELDSPAFESEKAEALRVVAALKNTGWSFASHGWGHLDAAKVSYDRFVKDTQRWKKEVEPLIGPTPVYIYPYGSTLKPADPKFRFLQEQGFRAFVGVGPTPYWKLTSGYALMDRRHIDGIALHDQRKRLLPLFDAAEAIDPIRPAVY